MPRRLAVVFYGSGFVPARVADTLGLTDYALRATRAGSCLEMRAAGRPEPSGGVPAHGISSARLPWALGWGPWGEGGRGVSVWGWGP